MKMFNIEVRSEGRRGCGYRKSGQDGVGRYLTSDGPSEPCERLPIPLEICPCCGGGFKFQKGLTWVNPSLLLADAPPCHLDLPPTLFDDEPTSLKELLARDFRAGTRFYHQHDKCPVCRPALCEGKAILMWVGAQHYSVEQFNREAIEMGISRRIGAVPNDFVLGKTFIFLAHIHACPPTDDHPDGTPGIFRVFLPQNLELVVDETDPEKLDEKTRIIIENYIERFPERVNVIKVEKKESPFDLAPKMTEEMELL